MIESKLTRQTEQKPELHNESLGAYIVFIQLHQTIRSVIGHQTPGETEKIDHKCEPAYI